MYPEKTEKPPEIGGFWVGGAGLPLPGLLVQLLAVVLGSHAGVFAEQLAEIVRVISQTDFLGNFVAVQRGITAYQQLGVSSA